MIPFLKPFMHAMGRGKLSVLIYHRVHARSDPLFPGEVDSRQFAEQIDWVKRLFNVMPLDEAVEMLKENALPPRAAAITFDDGYADNAEIALPVLQHYGANATFFVCTGYVDGGRMWNDTIIESVRRASGGVLNLDSINLGRHDISSDMARRTAIRMLIGALKYLPVDIRATKVAEVQAVVDAPLPDNLMMRSEQVRELDVAGMGVGAHTMTHPILARLDAASAREEISIGRERLQSILGKPISLFAYPNGKPGEDYLPEHVTMVRELGFKAALSTAWGVATSESDFFQLPRFTPWDRSSWRFSFRLAANLLRDGVAQQSG
ncbi:MAG TPA: polysaccharide deacetylase family protein [Burkholderiales bacterium]|nr:polysaccharide deacetylase family protein [Burkholderiales bacterium]